MTEHLDGAPPVVFRDLKAKAEYDEGVIAEYVRNNPSSSQMHGFVRVFMTVGGVLFYAFVIYGIVFVGWRIAQRLIH